MNRFIGELRHHVPFTAFGALTGMVLMLVFRNIPHEAAHRMFYVFHPLHVVFSAVVTTAIYRSYQCSHHGNKCSITALILVGYFGSVGIATLSDSLIPYIGELLLKLPNTKAHIGFIEEWWIVNPSALLGIVIGYFVPRTKFPHAGHVLISTWASLFHVLMALGNGLTAYLYVGIFFFLFLSVWIPCCVSDIVFPLLFVKDSARKCVSV